MPLKQSSFNFDFEPEDPGKVQEPLIPVEAEPALIREVEIPKTSLPKEAAKKSARGRMKLSDMNAQAGNIDIPEDAILFEKQYYSMGAVAEMFKVNQSLIRFWENEFDIIKPKKNGKGDRFFRPEDVKSLQLIHQLLRERKYTIEGAKEFLKKNNKAAENFKMVESLKKIKSFLVELKASL